MEPAGQVKDGRFYPYALFTEYLLNGGMAVFGVDYQVDDDGSVWMDIHL